MGIRVTSNSKNKESLKLYNHIASFLFEQEFGELKGNTTLTSALKAAQVELAKNIK